MSLTPGVRVGPYAVTALIGEGGMGEVYRARDTKLDRDVALKVLPDLFAQDAERLARFQREAKVLASLNHPNIAAIYGLEEADDVKALVLELVEGPTLADIIAGQDAPEAESLRSRARGSEGAAGRGGGAPRGLEVDEALPIAKQIAEALEAAHELGIIHRDLKPANVKVRHDGTVKVLDFGLAKALEPAVTSMDLSRSPTITSPAMTQRGVILGTAAYMSPEQARGRFVDKRTDVWAFACVLYEMLTGQRAFPGDDVTETLAAVVKLDPNWDLVGADVPGRVTQALRVCLQKDPRRRASDIHDVRLALEGAFEIPAVQRPSAVIAPVPQRPRWRGALTIATALVVGGLIAAITIGGLRSPESRLVVRFEHDLPEGQQLGFTNRPVIAFSVDGRQLVYNLQGGLYLRDMADLEARLIPGSESNSSGPFFSRDGRWVGYWAGGELKKIAVSGGAPIVLCGAGNPFGASWGADDTILFVELEGIMRVAADGGTPELVIRAEKGEQLYGPQLLPDGDSVLFSATTATGEARWNTAQIIVQSLRSGERKVLVNGGSDAQYVPTGHVLYAVGDVLFAVPFDVDDLEVTGGPVSVVRDVQRAPNPAVNSAAANYGVSANGSLVYLSGGLRLGARRMLAWVDRGGHEDPLTAPAREYIYPRISPDGVRAALWVGDQQNDIWIWDFARATFTRFTFDPAQDNQAVWTSDGRRLLWSSGREGPRNIFWQAADGTGSPERLLPAEAENKNRLPYAVTPDGTIAILREDAPDSTRHDLMTLSLTGEHRVEPLMRTSFDEANADISPDGRWIAYQSNESGQYEIYVRPFPDVNGGRWQISTIGGTRPQWSRDGRELFFMTTAGLVATLMRVPIEQSGTFRPGVPEKLFEGRYYFTDVTGSTGFGRTFDISPDGKRFLMVKDLTSSEDLSARPKIVVVEGWFEELKRLVPTN